MSREKGAVVFHDEGGRRVMGALFMSPKVDALTEADANRIYRSCRASPFEKGKLEEKAQQTSLGQAKGLGKNVHERPMQFHWRDDVFGTQERGLREEGALRGWAGFRRRKCARDVVGGGQVKEKANLK